MRRQGHDLPLERYERDLSYLKQEYYDKEFHLHLIFELAKTSIWTHLIQIKIVLYFLCIVEFRLINLC